MRDQLSPLHSLFNSFIDPVIIYNLDGEIKQMNRAAKHLLGLSIGENIFKSPQLKERKEYNLVKNYIKIEGVGVNDMLWRATLYSYKYGERILGSMAVFVKKGQIEKSKKLSNVKYAFDDILTKNKSMLHVIERAKRAAYSDLNTVVYGETGTGKELLVQSIHGFGTLRDKPFVAINCGAIPKELIGSELFGYEPGAFTGAREK